MVGVEGISNFRRSGCHVYCRESSNCAGFARAHTPTSFHEILMSGMYLRLYLFFLVPAHHFYPPIHAPHLQPQSNDVSQHTVSRRNDFTPHSAL